MEWEAFLAAKSKVLHLRHLQQSPSHQPSPMPLQSSPEHSHVISYDLTYRKLSPTTQTILRLLQQHPHFTYKDFMHYGTLTKDQVRHGLLWLIKNGMIEKIKAGQYRILLCN
jgi:hypothetical protein